MSDVRRRVVVHGRVQGVFFRAGLAERARALDLTGFAENRDDGTVLAELQGDMDAVEAAVSWCRHGTDAARVERLDTDEAPLTSDDTGFVTR